MSSTQIAGLRDLRERQAIAVQQMLECAQRAGRTQMVQTEKRAIKDLRFFRPCDVSNVIMGPLCWARERLLT